MMKKTAIMNFVESKGGEVQRNDLIKFIVEMNGKTYDPIEHRGYYSAALCPSFMWNGGYLLRPSKNEPRYLIRKKKWTLQTCKKEKLKVYISRKRVII